MNERLLKFTSFLSSYKKSGLSEWSDTGIIFTKSLIDYLNTKGCASLKSLKTLFSNVFGNEQLFVRTFILKKTVKSNNTFSSNGFGQFNGSLGGSPLLLEEHLEDVGEMTQDTHGLDQASLISESSARQIISYLHLILNQESSQDMKHELLVDLLPILIFCKREFSDQDASELIYIRTQLTSDGKLSGLVEECVNLSPGRYRSDTWRQEATASPNSSDHNNGIPPSVHFRFIEMLVKRNQNGTAAPVNMKSFSQFELFRSNKQLLDGVEQDVALTLVTADITCSKVQQLLGIDKQRIDDVKMNVSPVPGDMRSSAFSLYKSIQVLEGFFCAFGESGQVCWTTADDVSGKEANASEPRLSVVDKIHKVVASYGSEWMIWNTERKSITSSDTKKDRNESVSAEETASRQMFTPRKELDFTERVWEILQFVGSCDDLVTCFQIILKEITEGRATQFWLHRNNNTTIAKLIKESYKGAVSNPPELTRATCIKLLIELGLDKLLRDYYDFFITNRLSSAVRLSPYAGCDFAPNMCDVSIYQKKFTLLKKLHHIVELVVQCKLFLCLSDEQTFSVIRTALQEYVDEDLDFTKTFSFSVNYSEIESMVENTLPSVWRLTLTSGEKNTQKTTNVCWMTDYPFHGVIAQPVSDLNESIDMPVDRGVSTSSLQYDVELKYYIATQTTSIYT